MQQLTDTGLGLASEYCECDMPSENIYLLHFAGQQQQGEPGL